MASVFQRNKIEAMFTAFDADGDGCLRREDFEALADRWGRLPGAEPGTELRARVERAAMGWWEHLVAGADANGDGGVDLDELMDLVDRLHTLPDEVRATAEAIFDVVDADGDGRISRAEHRRLIDVWHGRSTDTGDVFDLLDLDGDGYLSRSGFAELWLQFWVSDDPAEPGNFVCGPLPGREAACAGGT
jgi:Ca2+-binding EF-hand superfamily protein